MSVYLHGMGYRSFIGWAALMAIAVGCSSSGGGGGMMPEPPLTLDGEYQIAVDTLLDRCGFGTEPASTPIFVVENGEDKATVDIPLGGAGGSCAPGPFDRVGNLLSRMLVSQQSVGMCVVDTLSVTLLEFFADGSVIGSESLTLTPVSGDCSAFGPACTVELSLIGDACSGCFSCVVSTTAIAPETGLAFGRIP